MTAKPFNPPSILVQPVVMAGGSGTRLWPLSRSAFPKQFLVLTEERRTLYQQAIARLMAVGGAGIDVAPSLTVSNEEHRFMVLDQLRELGDLQGRLILEPAGRNTAPAMTLAALEARGTTDLDPVLVVTPADHVIPDQAAFVSAMRVAVREAATGRIAILGIAPSRPETGFGYIQSEAGTGDTRRVLRFVEKPDLQKAQQYVAEGGYHWNGGMFVVKASVWLDVLGQFRSDILDASRKAWTLRQQDDRFVRPERAAFAAIPSESIDYAVMEPGPANGVNIAMVPLDAGWNDLGAWDAVWQAAHKDEAGNVALGDALVADSRNTLVHASTRLVSVVGVDDIMVIETPDAVLVADREKSQEVRQIVATLQAQGRAEKNFHRKVHRPWGWYDSIDSGPRFQVKRIMVKPGASLSLQMHHHRAEHWIVVTGTAEVTNGDEVLVLTENQSTYIPVGRKHRLGNPGMTPLEIIEVQSGGYLGEDDIVRFEDDYGRL
jgi:mannose-1-phosphate guanylyltransferase / mannose-6-phosphate isomerase